MKTQFNPILPSNAIAGKPQNFTLNILTPFPKWKKPGQSVSKAPHMDASSTETSLPATLVATRAASTSTAHALDTLVLLQLSFGNTTYTR